MPIEERTTVIDDGAVHAEEVVTVHEHDASTINHVTTRHVVSFVLGFIEILLAARFILRMLGANPVSGFVSLLYAVTGALLAPFVGIFRPAVSSGAETASVIEPATIIGMIVYAILAWGIVKTVRMFQERKIAAQV